MKKHAEKVAGLLAVVVVIVVAVAVVEVIGNDRGSSCSHLQNRRYFRTSREPRDLAILLQ